MKIPHVLQAGALSLALLGPAVAAPKAPPAFGDYPTRASDRPHAGPRPPLRLTTRTARRYTTVIHNAYKEPPDFAGHLRVAIWGCGTDCRNIAVLDQNTGRAFTFPDVNSISGAMGNSDERVDYRVDSRLLIVSGSFDNERVERKFYYLWTGDRLRRIFSEPLKIEADRP